MESIKHTDSNMLNAAESRDITGPARILRLDASANPEYSGSRKLGDYLVDRIAAEYGEFELRTRDVNLEAQFVDALWIDANFSPADSRTEAQMHRLEHSDRLIAELEWADHIVLTTPMYNFGIPATLKAWIDQVCRAGVTFRYGPNGPEGLLTGKRADIVITTGGAPLDSPVDFVSGYLRHVLAFIGIEDVEITGAAGMNQDAEQSIAGAHRQIEQRYPAAAA